MHHIFRLSDTIYKRKLKFLTNYSTRKTQYANSLKNILLTNWTLCTNICLVKLFKGELNPETNVGLNEYLREIKFCTGQESVDVVQRKMIFNDKNHYLFTYFKKCVLREDGSSYRPYYTFIYATSAFTKTLLTERRGTNV